VRALAVLGVEAGAFVVRITCVSTVTKSVDVVILAVVGEVAVAPHLNPAAAALAGGHVVAGNGIA